MVPGSGSVSNPDSEVLAQWKENSKDLLATLEGTSPSDVCDELFETLEEWNTYLERDVPYYRGPQP